MVDRRAFRWRISGSFGFDSGSQQARTVGGSIAPLAHDSDVIFQDLTVNNGANPDLTSSDAGVMMKGRKVISTPSAPNTGGNGFAVAFSKVAPPPPA
jgi:hypothetical protein